MCLNRGKGSSSIPHFLREKHTDSTRYGAFRYCGELLVLGQEEVQRGSDQESRHQPQSHRLQGS
jgi:hypothetical protein